MTRDTQVGLGRRHSAVVRGHGRWQTGIVDAAGTAGMLKQPARIHIEISLRAPARCSDSKRRTLLAPPRRLILLHTV